MSAAKNQTKDLLIEIGTEELPPKTLSKLSNAFYNGVKEGLEKSDLSFSEIKKICRTEKVSFIN